MGRKVYVVGVGMTKFEKPGSKSWDYPDMAKEAERILDGAGWLPEPLRLVDATASPAEEEGAAGRCPNSSATTRASNR